MGYFLRIIFKKWNATPLLSELTLCVGAFFLLIPPNGDTNGYNSAGKKEEEETEEPTKPPPYYDFLVNGVPKWQIENRGMTEEEAEAYKAEVARIGRSRRLEA